VASINLHKGANFATEDGATRLATAEATLIRALSLDPQHAQAHLHMGFLQLFTKRANQGIAECEQALALDRNLANAHGVIGLAKHFLGRGEETEAHIHEALRLSPRDINAFRWMMWVGIAKFQLNAESEAAAWLRRSIEANRNFPLAYFHLAVVLAQLGLLDEARATAQAGLNLDPGFTIRRFREGAPGDNPKFLAGRERMYEGMRMAGVPEA